MAPTRAEINEVNDLHEIYDMMAEASDAEISIKTQLEFLDDGDFDLRQRRVAALIMWRQAERNLKNRLNFLLAETARAQKAAAVPR